MSLAAQKWVVVGAIILGMGAHWAILQSVAWTGMVISYSLQSSFKEALHKTFDGKHPCPLCKQIAQGKRSEKKAEFAPAGKKFEFSYWPATFVFSAPSAYRVVRWQEEFLAPLFRAPPTPPPRQLPA